MGDFSEHVLFGLLVAVLIAFLAGDFLAIGRIESVASLVAVFLGSVIPDIDHKNSYVHRSVKALSSLVTGILMFVLLPFSLQINFGLAVAGFLGTYFLLSHLTVRHRGLTHTFSFCIIAASITVVTGVYTLESVAPGIAVGIGISSHLLLDGEFKL